MTEIKDIMQIFMDQMEIVLGNSMTKMLVYGSYARGDYEDNSDIDVMILTSLSEDEMLGIEDRVYDAAFDLEMKFGIHISVIMKNEMHFRYWLDTVPFYGNVLKEGIVVYR